MDKELISLDDYNKSIITSKFKHRLNGIKCPKCGEELVDSTSTVLFSDPVQRHIKCIRYDCNFKGTRYGN